MKVKILSGLVAATLSLGMGAAQAAPFYFDVGNDRGLLDGDSRTADINELGFTGTLATSIYIPAAGALPTDAGTQVIDTNRQSVMNAYGFTPGAKTNIDGGVADTGNLTPVGTFAYPVSPGQVNIDSLNASGGSADTEGFVSGIGIPPYGTDLSLLGVGYGGTAWGLTYDYSIGGVLTPTGVNFNTGDFALYYEDGTGPLQVLRINITASAISGVSLLLTGFVSFDFDNNGTDDTGGNTFIQNLFNDSASGQSFYDIWLADPTANSITFRLDTDVDPPIPTNSQLWCAGSGAGVSLAACQAASDTYMRQTALDGSATFATVPEPSVLALLGLGLLGIGLGRRANRKA